MKEKKIKEKPKEKESPAKAKTSEEFKKRKFSEAGNSVMDDLRKATNAEKEYRRGQEDKA